MKIDKDKLTDEIKPVSGQVLAKLRQSLQGKGKPWR